MKALWFFCPDAGGSHPAWIICQQMLINPENSSEISCGSYQMIQDLGSEQLVAAKGAHFYL